MKMHLRLLSLGLGLCALAGCTRKVDSDDAKFSITLPQSHGNIASKSWGSSLPETIANVNCYVVMLEGPESAMHDNVCKNAAGTPVANPGLVFGGYAPGTTIDLTVTPGERTIYIVGVEATNSAACIAFRTNSSSTDYSAPAIVAKTTKKLSPGNNEITLTASLTGAVQIDTCTGPDFPESAQTTITDWPWVVDDSGVVFSSVIHDNKLYLGGAFNYLGPHNGYGTELNASTGNRVPTFDDFKNAIWGDVYAVIPDGAGGWYVGGDFGGIGIGGRQRIARIKSDGTVHSWDVAEIPDGPVQALALHGNTLYVGGAFGMVGSTPRNNLFAYDLSSSPSNVTSWDPDVDDEVSDLQVDASGNIYAVGFFNYIGVGAIPRYGAAKFDSSGALTAWDPNLDSYAFDVHLSTVNSGRVYLCGSFTNAGVDTRWLVAAVDNSTGAVVSAFNPSLPFDSGTCLTIAEDSNGNVYAGGDALGMSLSDPSMNSGPFKLGSDGTVVTSFNPTLDDAVTAMTFYNGKLYVGGNFFTIDSEERYGLAALLPDGTVTAWQSGLAGSPYVLAAQAGRIYVGAEGMASIGGVSRVNFGVIDLITGRATDVDHVSDGAVYTLTKKDDKLLVGGAFTSFGGDFRSGFAMLDMDDGVLDPNVGLTLNIGPLHPSGTVYALASDGTYVYVGSSSLDLDTDANFGYLFRVNQSDGALDSGWMPQPDSTVKSLIIDGSAIYAAGDFGFWNGPLITGQIVKANKETLAPDPSFISPSFDAATNELFLNGGHLYVTGNFTTIDSLYTSYFLARLDATTGAMDTSWLSDADGSIEGLTFDGDDLYIAGDFSVLGGPNMDGVGKIDLTNPAFTQDPAFNLQDPGFMWAFDVHKWNGRLIITGNDGLSAQSASGGVQYFIKGVLAATLDGIFYYDYAPASP